MIQCKLKFKGYCQVFLYINFKHLMNINILVNMFKIYIKESLTISLKFQFTLNHIGLYTLF